jgi:hypothetical protein
MKEVQIENMNIYERDSLLNCQLDLDAPERLKRKI